MAGLPCEFSETSYAFNFAENLWRRARRSVLFAPIFPNLREEGARGGGYDLLIRFGAVPVLFQFKIPDYIRRRSGPHATRFTGSYYRFKIMPRRVSDQHEELLNHERAGTTVRYASPRFHRMADLHRHAIDGHVPANSKILPPSVIGALPDLADHHFDYDPVRPTWMRCSDPESGKGDFNIDSFVADVEKRLADQRDGETALSALSHFQALAEKSVSRLTKGTFPIDDAKKYHPVVSSAIMAQAIGCAFVLAIPAKAIASERSV